jgi:hypothetical protein
MSDKDDIYLGGICLIFILQLNIYLAKRGEPERKLTNHIESSARLSVNYRTFQRVEVSLGRVFQGYSAFCGIPRATPSQGCGFQTPTSV